MNPLSSCTIAASRACVTGSLSDTCTIQTVTETNTADGQETTWADTYTDVACKKTVANYKQIERLIGASEESEVYYAVTFASDQTLMAKDRLVMDDGDTLDIVAVPKISDQLFLMALCKSVG